MQAIKEKRQSSVPKSPEQGSGGFSELLETRFLAGLALAALFALVLYSVLAFNWPKFSRAEVFFGECAREMLATSNFVTPLYHGKPFFDKPILTYWLIILGFETFGVSHFVARIPSILAAVGTVLTTGLGTAYLFGRRAGVYAAYGVATSFMFFSFAALCMSDMMLVFFDTLTLCLIYAGIQSEKRRNLCWLLGFVSVGLAFVTKGPVGLVLPALFALIYLACTKQLALIKLHHVLLGLATVCAVASPWFVAAWKANGAWSMYYFFVRENLIRFAGSTYDTHRPIWFMVTSLFGGFLPWSIFLPFIAASSFRLWRRDFTSLQARKELYLWLWVVVLIGFFSVSRGKIDYYALPVYPACAALTGLYMTRWLQDTRRPMVVLGWLIAVCLIVAAPVSAFFLSRIVGNPDPAAWLFMPLALLVSGALMLLSMWHRRYLYAYSMTFFAVFMAAIGFGLQILPVIAAMQPAALYAQTIKMGADGARVGVHERIANWVDEVTFQTEREPVLLKSASDVANYLQFPGPCYVLVPEDVFAAINPEISRNFRILDRKPFIGRSVTPGYAFKSGGKLTGAVELLLVFNGRKAI